MSRAVCFTDPSGALRIGALDGDIRARRGTSRPRRASCPAPEAWRSLRSASGQEYALGDVELEAPGRARRSSSASVSTTAITRRRPAPRSRRLPIVFAKFTSALIGPGEAIVLPYDEPRHRLRGRARARDRHARSAGDRPGGARGGRRHHRLQRRVRARGAVRPRAPVHARQELRHVRAARPVHRGGRRTSTSVRSRSAARSPARSCRTRPPPT